MMHHKEIQKGFTLIETLIYLGLFVLIIGGSMVAVYQIIESTNRTNEKVVIQEDADFLLHKLDWAINGVKPTDILVTSDTLTITKPSGNMVFSFDSANANMLLDSEILNSSFVKISQVSGTDIFSKPASDKLVIIFTVNNQRFNATKYLH